MSDYHYFATRCLLNRINPNHKFMQQTYINNRMSSQLNTSSPSKTLPKPFTKKKTERERKWINIAVFFHLLILSNATIIKASITSNAIRQSSRQYSVPSSSEYSTHAMMSESKKLIVIINFS